MVLTLTLFPHSRFRHFHLHDEVCVKEGVTWYDHDMLEEDVKIHYLDELWEDDGIARLVTICVVWFEGLCYFKIVIFGIS